MKKLLSLIVLSVFIISCVPKTQTVYIEKPPARCENSATLKTSDYDNASRIDSLQNITTNEQNIVEIKSYIKDLRKVIKCYEDQIPEVKKDGK